MSDLFDRLLRLFEAGHAREMPDLMSDARFADAERTADAAVLIAVTDRPDGEGLKQRSDRPTFDGPGVILTQRPTTMRDHPGQVAFPGGKLEPGEDAVTAAERTIEAAPSRDRPHGRSRGLAASLPPRRTHTNMFGTTHTHIQACKYNAMQVVSDWRVVPLKEA